MDDERVAMLLRQLEAAKSPSDLYEDRTHEIEDAAWAFNWLFLQQRWPWFVTELVDKGASCPHEWLSRPSAAVRLNACRVLQCDDRIVPVLVPYLREYDWIGDSFWTFIAAAELLAQLGSRAAPALPTLTRVRSHAPDGSLPRIVAGELIRRIESAVAAAH